MSVDKSHATSGLFRTIPKPAALALIGLTGVIAFSYTYKASWVYVAAFIESILIATPIAGVANGKKVLLKREKIEGASVLKLGAPLLKLRLPFYKF